MEIQQIKEDFERSVNESYKKMLLFLGMDPEEEYDISYVNKINEAANLLLQVKQLIK